MGLVRGLIKGAVAKRLIDEARKPHNQQRAKDLFQKVTNKRSGGPSTRRGARY